MEAVLFGLGKFILAWVVGVVARICVMPFTPLKSADIAQKNAELLVTAAAWRGLVFGSAFVGALWYLSRF